MLTDIGKISDIDWRMKSSLHDYITRTRSFFPIRSSEDFYLAMVCSEMLSGKGSITAYLWMDDHHSLVTTSGLKNMTFSSFDIIFTRENNLFLPRDIYRGKIRPPLNFPQSGREFFLVYGSNHHIRASQQWHEDTKLPEDDTKLPEDCLGPRRRFLPVDTGSCS